MIRFLSLVLLSLFLCGVAHATIYRWTDAQGNVVFSDQKPPPGVPSRKIELTNPLPTVPVQSPPSSQIPQGAPNPPAQEAPALRILSPTDQETVRANNGDINVKLQAKPDLAPGQTITLYVDGKKAYSGRDLDIYLHNLDRGQHSTYAVLLDGSGNAVRRTKPVTFYIRRHSILFKKPAV